MSADPFEGVPSTPMERDLARRMRELEFLSGELSGVVKVSGYPEHLRRADLARIARDIHNAVFGTVVQ